MTEENMTDKKAFVFDTNFIIENKKRLDEVAKNLSTEFNVYVTQVSIDERIAQNCRESKEKFDKVEDCIKKYADIADVTMRKTFEEECAFYQTDTPKAYRKIFANNIIPYDKDETMFLKVLDRAYKKTPPFPMNEKSDHGFKDTVLWLSLIKYFKNNGENEVVFVTEDKGFGKNQDKLIEEFEKETNKSIKIMPNSYYDDLLKPQSNEQTNTSKNDLPDVSKFRRKITDVVSSLCFREGFDYWGNEISESTFTLSEKIDGAYIKIVFNSLYDDIKKYIFEQFVPAENLFNLDDRIANGSVSVPMYAIEDAYKLHEEVKEKYPDFLEQFYETAAEIFNRNYVAPIIETSDDDLPF